MKNKKPLFEKRKKLEATYPFALEDEKNFPVLLNKLKKILSGSERVLEICSGSGQHALCFAEAMPTLSWQPTELPEYLVALNEALDSAQLKNIKTAAVLDVSKKEQPGFVADVVYTSNTMHMFPWTVTQNMIVQASKVLPFKGLFIIYGPFKYKGEHTSESNRFLDSRIKKMNRHRGIRDFEEVKQVANTHSLMLKHDFSMPLNNHLLVFAKA